MLLFDPADVPESPAHASPELDVLKQYDAERDLVQGNVCFQAEDGIRATSVTGVQTCALPICRIRWSKTFD